MLLIHKGCTPPTSTLFHRNIKPLMYVNNGLLGSVYFEQFMHLYESFLGGFFPLYLPQIKIWTNFLQFLHSTISGLPEQTIIPPTLQFGKSQDGALTSLAVRMKFERPAVVPVLARFPPKIIAV